MEPSFAEEVADVDLGDQRLNKRLAIILERLGSQPHLSIPAAMHGRNEMECAYEFFDNEKVTSTKILSVHYAKSRKRASQEEECLLVQDTTEVVLTRPQQQVRGAGPLSSDTQFGAFIHPLIAFTTTGIPLGIVWHKDWARTKIKEGTPEEKSKALSNIPIEEKESIRWIEGLRAALKVADECPKTRCILLADSEADIYELFAEPRETSHGRPLELLIRASQVRATTQVGCDILEQARAAPCSYTATVNVSPRTARMGALETRKRRTARSARVANVEVRACSVTLRPPYRHDRKLPKVTVNIVLVEELNTPAGEEPLQWILVTTLPIDTHELIRAVVERYCQRWGIEVFFRTLKSGCRIEERQFETLSREMNCIAVYMIVAWRVMLLCQLGRECPDLDCETVFEPSEWKAVYAVVTNQKPPKVPPKLNVIVRMVASLGGYVIRAKTEPGTQTLWFGLQRMHDFANCYDSFGPGAREG